MRFTWDNNKNNLNKQKHKLSFEIAPKVFDDPVALSWEDKHFEDYDEERWITRFCAKSFSLQAGDG
jgi:uncharacterized DUF497 family protein